MTEIHVLLAEDDLLTQSLLGSYLEKELFIVKAVDNGGEMLKLLGKQNFQLLLLDLGLPDEDGLVLMRQIRMVSKIPIIVITSRTGHPDRISALEMGADDYLTKPFDPLELVLRIKNVLRRTREVAPEESLPYEQIPIGNGWRLVPQTRSVEDTNGKSISLTRAEYDVLIALARASNRVLTRDQLLDATSHFGNEPNERTIDVLIGRLRRKLDDGENSDDSIKTVTGYGYMLSVPK